MPAGRPVSVKVSAVGLVGLPVPADDVWPLPGDGWSQPCFSVG